MIKTSILKSFEQEESKTNVLYAGDDDLDRAAVYLSCVLYYSGYNFDYVPSYSTFPEELDLNKYNLIILSDYEANNISQETQERIENYTRQGGSFLMIGGWESFTGMNREYNNTPIADILPVSLKENDDRRNLFQGCLVVATEKGTKPFEGLLWNHPPVIGGYNSFELKNKADLLLKGKKLKIRPKDNWNFDLNIDREIIPLLAGWEYGKGKAYALAFDLAPHWIGGMVDWGTERVKIQFEDNFIEVGDSYLNFVTKLIQICHN